MTDRIYVALPDGHWLALNQPGFDAALVAGMQLTRVLSGAGAPARTEALLTAEQLAAHLHVPQSWIEQATWEGRLPHHRFGRYYRYSASAVMAAARYEPRLSRGRAE